MSQVRRGKQNGRSDITGSANGVGQSRKLKKALDQAKDIENDSFESFGSGISSMKTKIMRQRASDDELGFDRKIGKINKKELATAPPGHVSKAKKRKQTKQTTFAGSESDEEEQIQKPSKVQKIVEEHEEESDLEPATADPVSTASDEIRNSKEAAESSKKNGANTIKTTAARARNKSRVILSNSPETPAEKENNEFLNISDGLSQLAKNVDMLTTPSQHNSWKDLWHSEGELRLSESSKATDSSRKKLERTAEDWKSKYEHLRAALGEDTSSNDVQTLKKQYEELEGRFVKLRDLRMTEPEELLDKIKKVSAKRASLLEDHVKSVAKENDRLRSELDAARKVPSRKMETHRKDLDDVDTSLANVSCQTETDDVDMDELPRTRMKNTDGLEEKYQKLLDKCRKIQEERDEMALAARMMTEERDTLLEKLHDVAARVDYSSKERNENQKAIQFWKDKASTLTVELNTAKKIVTSAQAELGAQKVAAEKLVSHDHYLLYVERTLKLLEEMTGVKVTGIETSMRSVDDSDDEDEDDEDDEDEEEAFDRRMSIISNRRKSIRADASLIKSPETEECLVYKCEHKGNNGVLNYAISMPTKESSGGRCGYTPVQHRLIGSASPSSLPEFLADEMSFERTFLAAFFRRACSWLAQRT